MTDTQEALRLTNTQKFYAKTALERLAAEYAESKAVSHATEVRLLLARIEALHTDRCQPTPEETVSWQQRLMACGSDREQALAVMTEMWNKMLLTAVDPTHAIIDALMPMLENARTEIATKILFTVEQKFMALINDPNIPEDDSGPDIVFKEMIRFIQQGKDEAESGDDLWPNDPHIQAAAEMMRQQHPPQ